MDDTAAAVYNDLRDLIDRVTEMQRRKVLTVEGDPANTVPTVREALVLMDAAAQRLSTLNTLDL